MKHNLKAFSLKTLPDLALLCIAFYDYLPEHACILMYSLFSQNPLGHRTLAQTCQPDVFGCMVQDLPHIMPSLDLAAEPIPLWWTTDFINASPPGTEAKDEKWSLGTSQKIPFTEGWVAQKWINMAHLDGRWLNHFPALLLSSFEKPWISSIQVGDIRSPQDCGRIQLLLRGYLTLFGRLLQR